MVTVQGPRPPPSTTASATTTTTTTHQLVVYADDVNLLGDNIDIIKKNAETLMDARKEVDLDVNTDKTKYMLLSCHRNAGQNDYIKIGNRCFENVAQFEYLEVAVTNQNLIQQEMKKD
jgi:hypothetical protein